MIDINAGQLTDDQIRWEAAAARFREQPGLFFDWQWPDRTMWSKQKEILYSIRDNFGTVVHSAVEMGKDWIAARAMVWFYTTRFPCIVLGTSSTFGQLKDALWRELTLALDEAMWPHFIDRKETMELRRLQADGKPHGYDWVRLRKSIRAESMQGIHLAGKGDYPRILVVVDEASAFTADICEALIGQAHRILFIGNPLNVSGYMAKLIRAKNVPDPLVPGRLLWNIIHIDAKDSPNAREGIAWDKGGRVGPVPRPMPGIMTYGKYLACDSTWDSFSKTTRLHGHLPEDDESQLVAPRRWLEMAGEAYVEVPHVGDGATESPGRGPFSMGIDATEGQGDPFVAIVKDPRGIVEIVLMSAESMIDPEYGISDSTKQKDEALRLMRKWDIPGRRVCIDAAPGKVAIGDPLRGRGIVVRMIRFGGAPTKAGVKTYVDKRAEMFGQISEVCDPGRWLKAKAVEDGQQVEVSGYTRCMSLDLRGDSRDELEELINELAVIPKGRDKEGRLRIPSKNPTTAAARGEPCLKDIIGHSPDRADAFALACWAEKPPARKPIVRVGAGQLLVSG